MIFGHVISQIVATVARLGLADELAEGPRSSDDLARSTGADPDALTRLLHASAGLGLVREVGAGEFDLSPTGEWLRSEGPSLRHLAIAMAAPGHWRSLEGLFDVVVTGRPAPDEVLGMSLWEYYRHNPEERAAFAAAMADISSVVAEELVAHYDVSRFERIVDVGGSQGVVLARLLRPIPKRRVCSSTSPSSWPTPISTSGGEGWPAVSRWWEGTSSPTCPRAATCTC